MMQVQYMCGPVPSNIPNFRNLYLFIHCFWTGLTSKVARRTLHLFIVTSMSDTPPQGLSGNPIKVDLCRRNVSLYVPLVKMSAAWWYVGQ